MLDPELQHAVDNAYTPWPDMTLLASDRPLTEEETVLARQQYAQFTAGYDKTMKALGVIETHLTAYVRRQYRYRRGKAQQAIRKHRAAVVARDGYICGICGLDIESGRLSIDHILPITRGGDDSIDNLQPAHLSCNSRKQNRIGFDPLQSEAR